MDYIDVSIQTVVLLFCLTAPGSFLLSRFIGPEAWAAFPPAMRFAYSWTASSLLISVISALFLLIPQTYAYGIAWVILGASLSGGVISLKKIFARGFDKLEIFSLVVFFLILAMCVLSYPLSPYPSQESVGYGDLPSYYRVASNILNKHYPLIDFRIGDYPDEIYSPPIRFPLLAFVGSFFMHFFPNSSHIIGLFCTASGALSLYFGLSLLRFPGTNQNRTIALSTLLIVFSLYFNQNIFHIGLGALTLPAALYILILSSIWLFPEKTAYSRQVGMGIITGIAIIISRPEGLLFFIALIVSCALLLIIVSMQFAWRKGAIHFTAGFLSLILLAGFGASFSKNISLNRSMTLSYVKYSESEKTFKFAYDNDWWLLNFAFTKESLGEKGENKYNPNIAGEIAAHPLSFLIYATKGIRALGRENMIIFFTFCAIIAISRPNLRTYVLVTAFILFLYALFCTNFAFSKRQSVAIFLPLPFVLSWTVSQVFLLPKEKTSAAPGLTGDRPVPRIFSSTPFYLFFLAIILVAFSWPMYIYVSNIYNARTDPQNIAYTPAIETLRKIVKPGMTVASTYPQLLGYVLDTPSVGNFLLLGRIEKLIAKYTPDLILIDNFRMQNYTEFTCKKILIEDYIIIVNNPGTGFLVLQRNR